MSDQFSTTAFADLPLAAPLQQAARDIGFEYCTPIQAACLPIALDGRDVAGQAQTGTGKTAAFLLALFNTLLTRPARDNRKPNQPRALVVAPTRELAVQIHKDAVTLGAHTGLTLGLVYGGAGYDQQREMLREGVDVLIGTPGRLIDYHKQHVYDLRALDVAVLDEADRMFDMGFIKDIRFLLRRMPHPTERLSMLFSATLSHRVLELAYEHMNTPELIRIDPEQMTVDKIRQLVYMPAMAEKIPLLIGLLKRLEPGRTMVFVNTKRAADRVMAYLEGNGIHAEALSGDVPQKKRLRLLNQFENGELPVLVTTDVASRGLHIPDVTHVFNYDLPQDVEDYVHRIGRTARAGAEGDAISFACEDYAYSLPEIESYIGESLPKEMSHEELLAEVAPPAKLRDRRPRSSSGRGGQRRGRSRRTSKA
ncbi:MAG TPA: ATP-dependent RNA helicase RhlB [Gammaproteobacteria bacterium]|jgi:ATP-dependent RNA helicase RhlB|nr:ATP-dependent RNA helicase RhlB [Gammaproteobacteria bacterium]